MTTNIIICTLLLICIFGYICVCCIHIATNGNEDQYLIRNNITNNIANKVKEIINKLIISGEISTININSVNQNEYIDETCCICLSELVVDDTIHILPCKHKFHVDCIKQWLLKKQCCPLCKLELVNNNESINQNNNVNQIRIQLV